MMKSVTLRCVNISLICFGCAIILAMSVHHSIFIAVDDPFAYEWFDLYFFVQPYIKVLYIAGVLLFVGKEFFIKKPLKFKVKINLIIALVLPLLLFVQMQGWWEHKWGDSDSVAIKGDFNIYFSPKEVQKVIDISAKPLLPLASGQDKEDLLEIIKYLEDTREKAPGCFEVPSNSMEFLKTTVRLALIQVKLKPDDYYANVNVSKRYLDVAGTITQFKVSEEYLHLSEDYEKKGFQAARDLVKKFPDNSLAYKYLADHLNYSSEGDKKEALELYKRCLELDGKSQSCRDQYNQLRKET